MSLLIDWPNTAVNDVRALFSADVLSSPEPTAET